MNLINRVKNILLTPKTEWEKIEVEETQPAELTKQYLLPLAVIPAIATFIGFGLIGYRILGVHVGSIGIGIRQGITSLLSTLAGAFLTAFVINFLATRFESQQNFGQAFKLVVYSYTPMLVAGVLLILPSLSVLASLCGLYGLYLLYLGLGPLMKTPEEKKTIYFIMSLVVLIAAYAIMGTIIGGIFLTRTHL